MRGIEKSVNMVKYNNIIKAIEYDLKCRTTGRNIKSSIRRNIQNFHETYKDYDHEEADVYDDNGNLICHEIGDDHSVKIDWNNIDPDDYGRVHVVHNHPSSFANLPTFLSEGDLSQLLLREINGTFTTYNVEATMFGTPSDYIVKSVTACSPNGSKMTLIKGDNFPGRYNTYNDANAIFNQLLTKNENYRSMYEMNYKFNVRDALKNYPESEWRDLIYDSNFRQNISNQTLKQIGSLEDYLKQEGIYTKLGYIECKLEITSAKTFDERWNDNNDWEIERMVKT